MKHLTVAFAALLSAISLSYAPGSASRLLSYYPAWAKYQSPPYTAAQIPYTEMTNIVHAFLLLDANGRGGFHLYDRNFIEPALISSAHAAGVKVQVSVGGGVAAQAKAFRKVAASKAARRTFASNVHAFLVKYGYDGVDIDWEVPVAPRDTKNCTALMQALRAELPNPQWLISMAITAEPQNYGTGFDVPQLARIVDYFNVMTYDFTGSWSTYAGHNSPLYQSPYDPGQNGSLDTSMDLYTQTYGVAPAQLNMGTAFYGYQFASVGALWQSCSGVCGNTVTSYNYGTYIKQRINAQGWQSYLDGYAMAPYLLYDGGQGFITYDDPTSSANKVAYVLGQRGFGGIFMWDVSGDYDGSSQDLLTAMWNEFRQVGGDTRRSRWRRRLTNGTGVGIPRWFLGSLR
jgi:chitinase